MLFLAWFFYCLHYGNFSADALGRIRIKKSNLYYTRLIPFWVSRVSGAHLRGFASGPTHQGCSDGESLAMCGRFNRLGIWIPYQRQTSSVSHCLPQRHQCHTHTVLFLICVLALK